MGGYRIFRLAGGTSPSKLVDLSFKVKTDLTATDTKINTIITSTATNYSDNAENTTIHITTMPNISWAASSQNIIESHTQIGVTAQLSSVSTAYDITIPLTITGTAELLTDYVLSTKSVFIPSGSQYATITITINDDLWVEDDENIELKMEHIGNAVIETPDLHVITIQNDDDGYFSTPVKQTISFVKFFGDVFTIDGVTMVTGDEIGVFDPDGVLCGHVIIDNKDNSDILQHNSIFLGVSPQAYSNSNTVLSANNSCDIIMINNQSNGVLKRNIQQNTYDTYQWIIFVDPRGTIGETYVQKTATLSWDASTFSSEGKYVLKNEAGEIATGVDQQQYFEMQKEYQQLEAARF